MESNINPSYPPYGMATTQDVRNNFDHARTEINVLFGLTDTLASEHDATETEIDGVQSDVTTLQSQVATLQGQVTTLQGQVSTLQGQVTSLQSSVTALQSSDTAQNSTIATHTSQISANSSAISALQAVPGPFYSVATYSPGVNTASQVVLYHKLSVPVTFPANFGATTNGGSSFATSLVNATGSTVFNIDKCPAASDPTVGGNWSTIGTASYAPAGHTGTLATTGGTSQALSAGDRIRIVAPASPDATLSGVSMTLVGNR